MTKLLFKMTKLLLLIVNSIHQHSFVMPTKEASTDLGEKYLRCLAGGRGWNGSFAIAQDDKVIAQDDKVIACSRKLLFYVKRSLSVNKNSNIWVSSK